MYVALKLEVTSQAFVDIEVDTQVVTLTKNRQIKRMQTTGNDEVVALNHEWPAHAAGLMIVVPGVNILRVCQCHQVIGEAFEVIGHRVQVSHDLPHGFLTIPQW